jgi:kynureninase
VGDSVTTVSDTVPPELSDLTPASLAPHYSRFRVTERILLTGHSHQAWPDVAFSAQQQAWLDAAELVDDKWERAAAVAEQVREGWRRLLNDRAAEIALGQNTHELVARLLSAVLTPCGRDAGTRRRDCLVTTDGEFHTIRRQIDRLDEAGVAVVRVAARPVSTLAERLASAVNDRVACVLVSSVLFETAEIVPHLSVVAEACARDGATLLVDAYHHLNIVPFDVHALGLQHAFITGGGYKYCQLGEGNCFLRIPANCDLRPILTGWFSEFAELAATKSRHEVGYGNGAARFAGATYDPTSHYRAAAVFDFHRAHALTPPRLRGISSAQTALLERGFRDLNLDPGVADVVAVMPSGRAGFIAIRTPHAARTVAVLRSRGIYTDSRGQTLRLGPAPYVSDDQLGLAVTELGAVLRELDSNPTD